jgi:hypothetical protein
LAHLFPTVTEGITRSAPAAGEKSVAQVPAAPKVGMFVTEHSAVERMEWKRHCYAQLLDNWQNSTGAARRCHRRAYLEFAAADKAETAAAWAFIRQKTAHRP